MTLKIIYRGSLNSCNYACAYCPFGKTKANKTQLAQDELELGRFVHWVVTQKAAMRLLFTPWGEALIWPHYQQALIELSQLSYVESVAIQTNLSGSLNWLRLADTNKLSLWASYHPSETDLDVFIEQCQQAVDAGVQLSVGAVGLKENFSEIGALHDNLPVGVSFWVNAYKDVGQYYSASNTDYLQSLDDFFKTNLVDHHSLGKPCASGETVFTVDGVGDMRRCHFIEDVIGNIYKTNHQEFLKARCCTNQECGCYLGYIHLKDLQFEKYFGEGYFERYRLN